MKTTFINTNCPYLPCHKLDKWENCLFCYCPLYLLECKGTYKDLPNGLKDCSDCTIPHTEAGWDYVQDELAKQLFNGGAVQRKL